MGWNQKCGFCIDCVSFGTHVPSGQTCSRSTLDRIWWCLRSQVCRGVAGVTVFNVHVRLDAGVNFLQGQQGAQLLSLFDRTFILNWFDVENFDTET